MIKCLFNNRQIMRTKLDQKSSVHRSVHIYKVKKARALVDQLDRSLDYGSGG